jgi:hypothetical protein
VPPAGQAFPAGGLYVMRDPERSGTGHATIDAGPHGALSFGHSHADALSVELFAGGGPLFVDAGTFAYDGPERDAYRSTSAHNTVEVGGESACLPGASFKWRTVADARCDGWVDTGGLTWFRGHHDGYLRLAPPVMHRRDVVHPGSGVWIVTDVLSTEGEHSAVTRWHLAPEIQPSIAEQWDTGCLIELARGGQHVATMMLLADRGKVSLEPGKVSPQFGRETATTVVTWRAAVHRDLRVQSIVLDWTSLASRAVTIHSSAHDAREISSPFAALHPAAGHALHVGGEEASLGGGLHVRASTIWVEPAIGGAAGRVAAVGVGSCMIGDRPLSGHASAGHEPGARWLVATFENEVWSTNAGTLSPVDY